MTKKYQKNDLGAKIQIVKKQLKCKQTLKIRQNGEAKFVSFGIGKNVGKDFLIGLLDGSEKFDVLQ